MLGKRLRNVVDEEEEQIAETLAVHRPMKGVSSSGQAASNFPPRIQAGSRPASANQAGPLVVQHHLRTVGM